MFFRLNSYSPVGLGTWMTLAASDTLPDIRTAAAARRNAGEAPSKSPLAATSAAYGRAFVCASVPETF